MNLITLLEGAVVELVVVIGGFIAFGVVFDIFLHVGVVSELSSSGLLLSSVSFPLLPKLHPLLSTPGGDVIALLLVCEAV